MKETRARDIVVHTDLGPTTTIKLFKLDKQLYGRVNKIGIHILNPSEEELEQAMQDAFKHMFDAVYMYV